MPVVKLLNQNNDAIGDIELAADVFQVEVQPEILNLVVRAQRAAMRQGTHAAKTRGQVRGGGRKPWRQKGTGRARAGSSRSPLWRGGAVLFGPAPRDYDFKVNKKVRQLALKMALSSRVAEESLTVVDAITLPEIKTKLFAQMADKLGLKKALIVLDKPDTNVDFSSRNLPNVKVVAAESLNVYEVLKYPQLVLGKDAVTTITERLK